MAVNHRVAGSSPAFRATEARSIRTTCKLSCIRIIITVNSASLILHIIKLMRHFLIKLSQNSCGEVNSRVIAVIRFYETFYSRIRDKEPYATVVELADTLVLGSSDLIVQVQLLSVAPYCRVEKMGISPASWAGDRGFESHSCTQSGCSLSVKALVLGSRCSVFDSHHSDHTPLWWNRQTPWT